ncbi:hypothetical protein AB0O51_16290 [Streptomyces sp. NPDC090301]|uniref:hypothetical protein n=1 Tax=Streptomyces sp. NPDC090301 TaxID=3154975 RepID=UPI00342A99F3
MAQLNKAADRADRRGNVPFQLSFVRSQDSETPPPLARLIQGGRGGEVRLKLYLSITMMATAAPYDLRRPPTPQTWARMLALPPDTGPRRVSSNLRWLSKNNFIELSPRPGNTALIKLLPMDPGGVPYVRASTQGRYVGIPIEFWKRGWIIHLSATGIAVLFALLEAQGGYKEPRYLTRERRDSYGFSHATWTEATKELQRHEFLTVRREAQGSDFDYQRLRNLYWVDEGRFTDHPWTPAPEGSSR